MELLNTCRAGRPRFMELPTLLPNTSYPVPIWVLPPASPCALELGCVTQIPALPNNWLKQLGDGPWRLGRFGFDLKPAGLPVGSRELKAWGLHGSYVGVPGPGVWGHLDRPMEEMSHSPLSSHLLCCCLSAHLKKEETVHKTGAHERGHDERGKTQAQGGRQRGTVPVVGHTLPNQWSLHTARPPAWDGSSGFCTPEAHLTCARRAVPATTWGLGAVSVTETETGLNLSWVPTEPLAGTLGKGSGMVQRMAGPGTGFRDCWAWDKDCYLHATWCPTPSPLLMTLDTTSTATCNPTATPFP
mmetsp:Transcript_73063/g.128733  ORF Transcript_73063/g.128733 Transcript_73063/m.128733 type:complete len:300 (-) Transcript_73063:126-1025(-)